ncbi:MAG: hypothetical protein OXE41_11465 [Gammaproteobacteria bacterium]|nr:hypothetical protein [Gammaproteobacteria bacterium]
MTVSILESFAKFEGMPSTQRCLQWHSVCVAQPPEDLTVLAASDVCHNQTMGVGGSTWSMQYHVEIELDTIAFHSAPDYYDELDQNELIAHEQDVLAYASRSLGQIDGFEFIGTAKGQGRSHILNLKKVHPFDVGAILD